MRRALRALFDGKQLKQIPWCPPLAITYFEWLVRYATIKLKKWEIEGFKHTEELLNMYVMFDSIVKEQRAKAYESKKVSKTDAKTTTKKEGNVMTKTWQDKMNLGNTKSDALPFIRKMMDNDLSN